MLILQCLVTLNPNFMQGFFYLVRFTMKFIQCFKTKEKLCGRIEYVGEI